jgi:hypothetical protein
MLHRLSACHVGGLTGFTPVKGLATPRGAAGEGLLRLSRYKRNTPDAAAHRLFPASSWSAAGTVFVVARVGAKVGAEKPG